MSAKGLLRRSTNDLTAGLFTLGALFRVTIIGIPVALVLLVLGRRVLHAPFYTPR